MSQAKCPPSDETKRQGRGGGGVINITDIMVTMTSDEKCYILYRVAQKSWHFWILCQIKNMTHFGKIVMYGWLKVSSIIWHPTIWNLVMLGWALATFVKGMKIRLRNNSLSILDEREVPSVEIVGGVRNLLWIMMDMGCAVYDMAYVIKSLWMSGHALHFNHSGIVEVLLALPGVALVMVAASVGVLGEVTVHVVG